MKSSARDGQSVDASIPGFADELKKLYQAAGGGKDLSYPLVLSRTLKRDEQVDKRRLSAWFLGKEVPRKPEHVAYVMRGLIPYLNKRAARSPAHQGKSEATWGSLLRAAQAVSRSGQGGRGTRVDAASRGRLLRGPSRALRDVFPRRFEEREEELTELEAFATAPHGAPAYLWWQGGAWAGKTALLAWFAGLQLPAGVDVAHYFISGRLGTDRREGFVREVGEQLASAAGMRRPPAVDVEHPDLSRLYEAAARACADRDRRLLLIVDGLDEDADAGPDGAGIAGLLPKEPPHGMRVIVTGRPNPLVPRKLSPDHPLRDPGIIRHLPDSPAARIIRDMAEEELDGLLTDPDTGQRLLGLLTAAQGALTGSDLGELLGTSPFLVHQKLRSVVGRSMAPTEIDRLALGARAAAEADAEAGRQTFVLAHDELHRAAAEALGEAALATYRQDLHAWAETYRVRNWPENTPNYLLTAYTHLVERGGDADRLADLVLDPGRQLRLVQRSGPDVALADLALVARGSGLAVPAGVAVSRESLLSYTRSLPRSVARTAAVNGDVRRARALASSSPQAAARATALAAVAQVLRDGGRKEDAAETAREAAQQARTALREAGQRLGYVADEAEEAAGQAVLALLVTGQIDAGLELLRSTHGSSTARYDAWAEAAALLAPDHPHYAAGLLDELEEEASERAEDPGEGSAVAVQIWETVLAADPDRADRLHDRILAHARQVWDAAPTLENLSVLALAASALSQDRPEPAADFADVARRHMESVLLSGGAPPMSAADAFHVEFGFHHTLARLSRALTDTGTAPDDVRRLLEEVRRALPAGTGVRSEPLEADEYGDDEAEAEAERLADEAFRLSGLGRGGEAKDCLDSALALLPMAGPGMGHAPVWLPGLTAALVRTGEAEGGEELLDLWQDPAGRARAHAAMALAATDLGSLRDARRHAYRAAQAVAGIVPDGSPEPYDGTWAHAAQALASAGEGEGAAALYLLRKHTMPADRTRRAAWRYNDRLARIAVATELAEHDPQASEELLQPLLDGLYASRKSPTGASTLLARLAEFLPAAARIPGGPHGELLHEVREVGLAHMNRAPAETWQPESVLVHTLLRIGAGEHPGRQLDWLTRDLANRGPAHFPSAALAVVRAACGDNEEARQVAERPTNPRARAAAHAAVAGHLARVEVRPVPGPDPAQPDPFVRTIRHLALTVTPRQPADPRTAAGFLHRSLDSAGWYHALPVLTRVEPGAVARIRDIAAAHARARQDGRSD
ncbi:hypothetical protein [Streptomyces sp. NPDC088762]|uniref:hypothetical protein n=1 Tax=Streptomyces sp. NPDC088762 TaxID=3365891 RepID=UPI0037F8D54D